MTISALTNRMHWNNKEYLIQTSWLEEKKRIISSLFSDGKFLSKEAFEYDQGLSPEELARLLKIVHQTRYEEAARLFELSKNPNGERNQADVRFLLGEAFYHHRLFEEAEAELRQSLDLEPGNPKAVELLARIYLNSGKYSEAREHLQQALEQYPNYADFRLLFSRAVAALDQYPLAIAEIEKAIQINPYYAQAYFELGLVLIQNVLKRIEYELTVGMPARAIQSFSQAVQLNPGYATEYFRSGLDLLRQGDYGSALEQLGRSSEKERGRPKDYLHEYYLKYLYSNGWLEERSLTQQVKFLQQQAEKNPAYADLHFQLGTLYMLLCRYITQKAIGEYKKALESNPGYKKAERNMKLCENDVKGMDLLLRAML